MLFAALRGTRTIHLLKGLPVLSPFDLVLKVIYRYRYDGLYEVVRAWQEKGKAGFLMCKFALQVSSFPFPSLTLLQSKLTSHPPPSVSPPNVLSPDRNTPPNGGTPVPPNLGCLGHQSPGQRNARSWRKRRMRRNNRQRAKL